jgi:hypothetical protein
MPTENSLNELDLEDLDENTPLIRRPTTSNYLGVSGTSSSTVPSGPGHVLQLSNHIEEELNSEYQNGIALSARQNIKTHNKELRLRINRDYPFRYVFLNSIFTLVLSGIMIYFERNSNTQFQLEDIYVISFRSLNGFILLGACINAICCSLALLTLILRKYCLIHVVTVLKLVCGIVSFIYLIVFNIVVLIFTLIGTSDCGFDCILIRSSMILMGVIMTILNVIYFLVIQLNFLKSISITNQN